MQPPVLPKLSVLVLTHNHEAFIGQALDSVVMQETTFAYEIIVGEDGSTDQTRAIVEDYHRRYPELIRPVYQAGNAGVGANLRASFQACQGQYLAVLEGDDYWTSPHKLQTQADWLDAHPAYAMCYHDVVSLCQGPDGSSELIPFERHTGEKTEIEFPDFLQTTPTHISTVVLRQMPEALPDWLFNVYPIDMPLLILYAARGKVRRLPGGWSVYRVHMGGSWSGANRQRRVGQFVPMYARLHQHYQGTPHAAQLNWGYGKMFLSIADESTKLGSLAEARHYMGRFWAAEIGLLNKAKLLKAWAGVSGRMAWQYLRAGLHTQRPAPEA